jgi:hypothetical protein
MRFATSIGPVASLMVSALRELAAGGESTGETWDKPAYVGRPVPGLPMRSATSIGPVASIMVSALRELAAGGD